MFLYSIKIRKDPILAMPKSQKSPLKTAGFFKNPKTSKPKD
ncbi:hypothetical protein SC09_contig12orf00009 [Bacillus subtilis]|uniref:Uncharacterized protein n=1 Tax=Bacillus subtilis TaxID=1423 RepID=A0A0D1L2N6_BACIU|nr:hypothetical protein SC09_contig12orf00009 [Bacillus subtilis]